MARRLGETRTLLAMTHATNIDGSQMSTPDWTREIKKYPGMWECVIENAERAHPGFGEFYRRLVSHPGKYYSYRRFTEIVGTAIGSYEAFGKTGSAETSRVLLKSAWPDLILNTSGASHQWQSYLVSANIFDALALTDPPVEWDLEGASKLPFDALYFLLPQGSLPVGESDSVMVIGICQVKPEVLKRLHITLEGDESLLGVGYCQSGKILFCNQKLVAGEKFSSAQDTSFRSLIDDADKGKDVERNVSALLIPLALQFVTVMNNASDMVLPGRLLGHVGKASRGTRKEKAEPAWIGRYFQIPRSHDAPSGGGGGGERTGDGTRTVRPHFRRGHWRGVRHGKGRKFLRAEWFPPTFVNPNRS